MPQQRGQTDEHRRKIFATLGAHFSRGRAGGLARLSFTIQLRGGFAHPHCQQLATIETETSLVTRAPRLFIAPDLHSACTVLGRICGGLTALAGIGLIAMPTGILAAAFSDAFQLRRS